MTDNTLTCSRAMLYNLCHWLSHCPQGCYCVIVKLLDVCYLLLSQLLVLSWSFVTSLILELDKETIQVCPCAESGHVLWLAGTVESSLMLS
jgi:hypothetical protein